jgi:hypothetical protein
MKALVYDEYTLDDDFSKILKIKEIPTPEPKSDEVIFKVKAAALNYDDIWGMRGKPLAIPLPHISGTDAAFLELMLQVKLLQLAAMLKISKLETGLFRMEICLAEYVRPVLMAENLIVDNELFGDLKQAHFGEVIANLHIFQKSML